MPTRPELEPAGRASRAGSMASLTLIALVAATVGCAPAENEQPIQESAEPTTSAGEGPTPSETRLGDVRVGSALDPEGAVPADRATDRFTPGESIYVSMAIDEAPANAAVHAVFYDSTGETMAEDEKKVPAQASYLYFDAGDTSNWLPGRYVVELAVDGEVRTREEITLADGSGGGG